MLISPGSDFHHWSRGVSITIRTAVYGTVRTVVWEGRRSDPSPYPDPKACATSRSGALSRIAAAAHHPAVGELNHAMAVRRIRLGVRHLDDRRALSTELLEQL